MITSWVNIEEHIPVLWKEEATNNSIIDSYFNYCALVWHLCTSKFSNMHEQKQKCSPRIAVNDNESNYETSWKSIKTAKIVKRMGSLEIEILKLLYKLLSTLSKLFMKEIFTKNPANIYLFNVNNRSTRKRC